MKKIVLIALAIVSTSVFAGSHEGGTSFTDDAVKYFAYFLGLGLAVFSGTKAQSHAVATALEGIARNPSAAEKVQTPMILGLALMESLVIFMLISPYLIG